MHCTAAVVLCCVSHLAEAAVDALGHVDVVAGGAPAAVLTLLSLNRDGLAAISHAADGGSSRLQ
jgi:hypothetical protein